MTKNKGKPEKAEDLREEPTGAAQDPSSGEGASEGAALVEPAPEAVHRLEDEVAETRTALAQTTDRYLRLAAEFDNFKKRAARERTDLWARAQGDVLERLVDALDDLGRFAHVDPAQTDAKTIHDGVDMVERKIWKQLEGLGVSRLDQTGVPFDPRVHEAVTMQPAAQAAEDQTVGVVLQRGYKLGEVLIRPARVVVLSWQGTAPSPADG